MEQRDIGGRGKRRMRNRSGVYLSLDSLSFSLSAYMVKGGEWDTLILADSGIGRMVVKRHREKEVDR